MKKHYILLFVLLFSSLILSACASSSTPEPGTAIVKGKVISEISGEPLSDAIVRLAEVFRRPDEEEEDLVMLDQAFSPGTRTDNQGNFVFESVEPMEYVIVVGDVENTYRIVADDSGIASVFKAEPDQVLDVGELIVELTEDDL